MQGFQVVGLEQLGVLLVAVVLRRELSNCVIPQCYTFIEVRCLGLPEMHIQETVNKLKHGNSRLFPGYNTQEGPKHLTQSLHKYLRLIINQRIQTILLNTLHNQLRVKLSLSNQRRYQVYQRPQYLWVITYLEYFYGNREYSVQYVCAVYGCTSEQDHSV